MCLRNKPRSCLNCETVMLLFDGSPIYVESDWTVPHVFFFCSACFSVMAGCSYDKYLKSIRPGGYLTEQEFIDFTGITLGMKINPLPGVHLTAREWKYFTGKSII